MKKEEFEVDYDEVIRALDGEMDDMKERYTRMGAYRRVLDAARDACARDAKLNDELERQQSEIDDLNEQLEQKDAEIANLRQQHQSEIANLRQQLLEVKEQKLASETKLSELSKLSAGVAKKSSLDDMIKAMHSYLNISKRKTQVKREAAKMVFTELFSSAKMDLPEDISELLEHLDDAQAEAKVVNVTGNYNDVHDNNNVDMNETKE